MKNYSLLLLSLAIITHTTKPLSETEKAAGAAGALIVGALGYYLWPSNTPATTTNKIEETNKEEKQEEKKEPLTDNLNNQNSEPQEPKIPSIQNLEPKEEPSIRVLPQPAQLPTKDKMDKFLNKLAEYQQSHGY